MEQKFIRAFGYIFTQNTYEQGLRYKLIPKEIITCTIICSRGRAESYDAETGERLPDNFAGRMFAATDFDRPQGYDILVTEPTTVYCYDELMNDNHKLDLEPVDLPQGQNTVFENGTKFLLCEGVLYINSVSFTAPAAISITTGDKVVTPETRCLGLKIA